MARKEVGQTAGSRLETLRAQIGALVKRRTALQAEQPDTADPAGWVAKRAAAAGELAALETMIGALRAEEGAAEAQLREAAREETALAAAELRAGLEPLLAIVADKADALDDALKDVETQTAAIRAMGGWSPPTGIEPLRHALAQTRGSWRKAWPGLVDAPPRSTPAEQAIADARGEVLRLKRLRDEARQRGPGPRGELDGDNARLVEMYTVSLRQAEDRLATLEGRETAAPPAAETTGPRGAGSMVATWEE